MVLLDRDEDEILHAVESGDLGWAWDIAVPTAERREIRIWRESLLALAAGKRDPDLEPHAVIARILPPAHIRSPQLQRLWSCSSTHIHALLDSDAIAVEAAPVARSGPQSYTLIRRESIAAFLSNRRVC